MVDGLRYWEMETVRGCMQQDRIWIISDEMMRTIIWELRLYGRTRPEVVRGFVRGRDWDVFSLAEWNDDLDI